MEKQALNKQDNSAVVPIELHSTCPISKMQTVHTNFSLRMMQKAPFHWLPSKKPLPAEAKRIISLGNEALQKLEEKASEEEIKAMFLMLSGGLKSQPREDEKATAVAYLFSLNGLSRWAIKTATRDVMKGKAAGLSTTFMPASADLMLYCEKLENDIRTTVKGIFTSLDRPEIKPKGEPVSAEKWAKLMQMLKKPKISLSALGNQSDEVA